MQLCNIYDITYIYIMHTRQYSKQLTYFNKFNIHNNLLRWDYYMYFAAYEETGPER